MLLDELELKKVTRELVLANSSSFLYRRLVGNPSVNVLALRGAETLLARVREVHAAENPTFVELADAYAAAVAAGRLREIPALEKIAQGQGHLKFLAGLIKLAKSSTSPSVQVKAVGPNDYAIDLSAGTGSWKKPNFTFEQSSSSAERVASLKGTQK